jgi:hypothetical protein
MWHRVRQLLEGGIRGFTGVVPRVVYIAQVSIIFSCLRESTAKAAARNKYKYKG